MTDKELAHEIIDEHLPGDITPEEVEMMQWLLGKVASQ